jgi:hypothetical protein
MFRQPEQLRQPNFLVEGDTTCLMHMVQFWLLNLAIAKLMAIALLKL